MIAGDASRKLILLRHAKSAWPAVPDHERPLAARGQRDAPIIGRWLRDAGHMPDQVLCSTARRARETYDLVRHGLQATPAVTFDDRIYGASGAQLAELVRDTASGTRTLMLVGHDPAIPDLTLALAHAMAEGDAASGALSRIAAKFPTAAVAVLQSEGTWGQLCPGSMRLTGFVTPRNLRASGARGARPT